MAHVFMFELRFFVLLANINIPTVYIVLFTIAYCANLVL